MMERLARGNAHAAELAQAAEEHLDRALLAVERRRAPWIHRGAAIDTVETNINAAICLMLRYMPAAELLGRMPDILATLEEHLPSQDQHRLAVDKLVRNKQATHTLDASERAVIVSAVRSALWAQEREYLRVRSFRNIVYLLTVLLALIVTGIGITTYRIPTMLPMCFNPEDALIVCPTQSVSLKLLAPVPASLSKRLTAEELGITFAQAARPEDFIVITTLEPTSKELNAAYLVGAHRGDYLLLEAVGLIAAAVAAAFTLRQMGGTSVPYSVPLALAFLKLPTGALTAVLGLLLMRGEFVPGLSNLDSSAQIVAWAAIFGYAQQIFTRLIDQRGQAVLNAVGSPENPSTLDQRLVSTMNANT
ncbi:hypothetical protein [Hyalangium rubrum]|uniref:Uncharacterized protein n=1 Tax=Hyalangium rubrum TaxID=3103134 RepID=A0ABU5HII1_9BACT|nr:hypothetical protein [Hyalangium sp. s54d21]MDY7233267.1 hypothetical protein [Hyalangium sp. s54d21]